MKKLMAMLAAMLLCVSLVACGGVDTQPAIDAYNELCDNYNKIVDMVNEDIDSYDQEDVDFLNSLTAELDRYREQFDNNTEFTQEEVDQMVKDFKEINDVVLESLETWGE